MVAELGALHPDDVTLLDMEASIEHLSRGTVRHVETLLVIAEPYFRALETLGRIAPLAQELGIPTIRVVANKIRTDRDLVAIQDYSARLGLEVLEAIPFDDAVQEADQQASALLDYAPTTPAVVAIERLVDRLALQPRVS